MSSDQEPHRRRAAGTGPLVHAGAATAQTKSLRRYRKRQEQRFAHKASALRDYKKAMKKEGYEAGRGAGRKRYRDNKGIGSDEEVRRRADAPGAAGAYDDEEAQSDEGERSNHKSQKRRKKIDPMAHIRRKAEEKREERSRIVEEREQKKKADVSKERQRKKNYRSKQKRTRKGQPIMGDMIKGMLEKLQNDADN